MLWVMASTTQLWWSSEILKTASRTSLRWTRRHFLFFFSKLHHFITPVFLSSVLSALPQFSQAPWMTHTRPSAPPMPSPVHPKQRYPEPQTTGQIDHLHLLLPKTTPSRPALSWSLIFWCGIIAQKHWVLHYKWLETKITEMKLWLPFLGGSYCFVKMSLLLCTTVLTWMY